VQAYLERRGLTSGWIRALAVAYAKHGAARGLVDEVEKEWRERVPRLEALLSIERKVHASLHELLGGLESFIDLAPPAKGARSRYVQSMRGRPCDLASTCDTWRPEIVRHAEFVRWLEAQIAMLRKGADAPLSPPRALRRELETRGAALLEKGSIVSLFIDEHGLELKYVALLVLAHGYELTLPIKETRLTATAHAMSEALHDWRRRQKRPRRSRES
jgi:hypothetical protein